jgi:hypothetical protein
MTDTQSRQKALLAILDTLVRMPLRVLFHTAWLGSVLLAVGNIDPLTLSQPMQLWFATLGGNALFEPIKRVANGEKVSETTVVHIGDKQMVNREEIRLLNLNYSTHTTF